MKLTTKFFTLLVLLALLLMPTQAAFAKGADDGRVVLAGVYNLQSGETLEGDLVVIGGVATIETGATVSGNIVLIGGSFTMNGTVTGDIAVIGGAANLGEKAVVEGDLVTVGVGVTRAEGSVVKGQTVSGASGPVIEFGGANSNVIPPIVISPSPSGLGGVTVPNLVDKVFFPVMRAGSLLFISIILAVIALLVSLFLEQPTQRVATAISHQGVLAGGMGFLTILVAPIAIFLLAITIILSPVAFLAFIALGVSFVFGWIALGLEVGDRFSKMFKTNLPMPLEAGLGTLMISLVAGALFLVPQPFGFCFGALLLTLLFFISLGAVVITRFGTRMVIPPLTPSPAVATVAAAPSNNEPLPPVS